MPSLAVLDACVLFPMPLCDTLLRIAELDLYRPYFSQEILNEATRNLVKKGRMTEAKAARYQEHIKLAFPEAMVDAPEQLVSMMTNHPKDRHVLATGVKAKADVIVTFNLKDFLPEDLEPWEIEAQHPDEFLLDLCESLTVNTLLQVIREQAQDLKRPHTTVRELIAKLSTQTPKFSSKILCHECGRTVIEIAQKTLREVGKSLEDGGKIFDGKQYTIKERMNVLTIFHKPENREVLNLKGRKLEGSLKIIDIEKFEDFSQSLNKEIAQKG